MGRYYTPEYSKILQWNILSIGYLSVTLGKDHHIHTVMLGKDRHIRIHACAHGDNVPMEPERWRLRMRWRLRDCSGETEKAGKREKYFRLGEGFWCSLYKQPLMNRIVVIITMGVTNVNLSF